MKIQDFANNRKYKSILPILYIISWILMIIGPLTFPREYQIYCLINFAFLSLKSSLTLISCAIGSFRSWKLLKNYQIQKQSKQPFGQDIIHQISSLQCLHAFILPSYKEDISLLKSTLNQLASHRHSQQRYLVYLAMEEHQKDSDIKAKFLIEQFSTKFRQMGFTRHQIKQHQQKGKASNVSWCVEHLQHDFFEKGAIDQSSVYLTIIDADSWVPEAYINNLDLHINAQKDQSFQYIYTPFQIFTRNHMEVPFMTRTYDQSHSMVHFSNIVSIFSAGFPLSNYTVSYELMKRIGFWDTCADAIGQDFHTTLKAFWKTQGQIKTIPIYIPFNQVNVQTGQGYCSDLSARFWQAQRHARGCADFAYCLKMLIDKKLTWRTILISYNSMQCFILPALIPWAIIGSTFQNILSTYLSHPPQLFNPIYADIFFKIFTYTFIVCYFFYFTIKRKTNTVLYKRQNQSLWRIIEFPLMIPVNLFLVSVPTFVIAAFKVFLNINEYEVAKKKISHQIDPR